ncbi:MAG TPA: hypothetical protein VE288_12155 [Rubrobacteraceae bacterium]|nr:hypothetical protein [Rubrobacteraceae bacterium]
MSEGSSKLTVALIRRILMTAYKLGDPRYTGGVIRMEEVGREIGVHDRDLLEKITRVLVINKDLRPDPETNEIDMFRVTRQGRAKVHRWRHEGQA